MTRIIDYSGLRGRDSDRASKSRNAPESNAVYLHAQRRKRQSGNDRKAVKNERRI